MRKNLPTLLILIAILLIIPACSSQVSQPQPLPQAQKAYIGSMNSDKYHRPACEWARKIKPDNAVWFSSPEEAKKTGYKPCKVCRPPG